MEHYYKGYLLERNGTREFPWNIYKVYHIAKAGPYAGKPVWEWVSFGKTMKECKVLIDDGIIEMCEQMCR